MEMKPLKIAGGGLAGLALGLALRRESVPVTVIESATYPRHRVCGEFISGITDAELESLGMEGLMAGATQLQETLWFDGERPMLRTSLPNQARGISRHLLDGIMAERFVAHGGALLTGQRFTDPAIEGIVLDRTEGAFPGIAAQGGPGASFGKRWLSGDDARGGGSR